eukprot:6172400-Pleurochrysis_carterae.AAC.1
MPSKAAFRLPELACATILKAGCAIAIQLIQSSYDAQRRHDFERCFTVNIRRFMDTWLMLALDCRSPQRQMCLNHATRRSNIFACTTSSVG